MEPSKETNYFFKISIFYFNLIFYIYFTNNIMYVAKKLTCDLECLGYHFFGIQDVQKDLDEEVS